MAGVRLVELPRATMATSGNQELDRIDQWFSRIDRERQDPFFPRDFMYFDQEAQRLVWYYALPAGVTETEGFATEAFDGGLYAAAVSRDQDDKDGERVYREVREWVESSGCLELDECPGRYALFHVITSERAFQVLGYRQLDIYVPVRAKEAEQ